MLQRFVSTNNFRLHTVEEECGWRDKIQVTKMKCLRVV